MRARTSSGDSGRSASPPPDTPPSPASSPSPDSPPLPAVKGVVEKQDSVSWVLEIEETPEEVASRYCSIFFLAYCYVVAFIPTTHPFLVVGVVRCN